MKTNDVIEIIKQEYQLALKQAPNKFWTDFYNMKFKHTMSCYKLAKEFLRKIDGNDKDKKLLLNSVLWHDIGRFIESESYNDHCSLGLKLFKDKYEDLFHPFTDRQELSMIKDVILYHGSLKYEVEEDNHISMAVKFVRDIDKLDNLMSLHSDSSVHVNYMLKKGIKREGKVSTMVWLFFNSNQLIPRDFCLNFTDFVYYYNAWMNDFNFNVIKERAKHYVVDIECFDIKDTDEKL